MGCDGDNNDTSSKLPRSYFDEALDGPRTQENFMKKLREFWAVAGELCQVYVEFHGLPPNPNLKDQRDVFAAIELSTSVQIKIVEAEEDDHNPNPNSSPLLHLRLNGACEQHIEAAKGRLQSYVDALIKNPGKRVSERHRSFLPAEQYIKSQT
ncbi:hypothetical protein ACHQM5_030262 [Ranunculus cassubicifolius]